jgi:hypothetical protein
MLLDYLVPLITESILAKKVTTLESKNASP